MTSEMENWWDDHWQLFVQDLRYLLEVPSVSIPGDNPDAPYGQECVKVLRRMAEIANRLGFSVTNQENHCLLVDWGDDPAFSIGIFNHLDVVPAGDGWSYPPFGLTQLDDILIGRGTGDNKGPALVTLYAERYLYESGFKPRHTIRHFYGVNEEKAMQDVVYFREHNAMPLFSLVPDANFPVCHGEKGIMSISAVRSILPTSRIISWNSGIMSNAVPATAKAVLDYPFDSFAHCSLDGVTVDKNADGTVTVKAKGVSAHAAMPEGSRSAQNMLCAFLLQNTRLAICDKALCRSILSLFSDYYGKGIGVPLVDDISGHLTHVGGYSRFDRKDGAVFTQDINIRYCITADEKAMQESIAKTLKAAGFNIASLTDSKPTYMDEKLPVVQELTRIANEVTGLDHKPYVMGGGTYARNLHNAVGFGPGIPGGKDRFGSSRGHGHQCDEYIPIDHLKKGFDAYVRALPAVDALV